MESVCLSMRRLLIAAGFAVVVTAPLAGAALSASVDHRPSPLAACSGGEEYDSYTGHCVPYLVPRTSRSLGTNPDFCPPGVSGTECGGSTGDTASSPQPQMPAPVPPQEPEQELAEISTPGY
ncbi:hypothetical protein MHAS_03270 [Mycolicibacterium hassiacum DSM 44199]|jgi:hypothetical protein|nr:hypothetical protein [Mycolicibacterium hassiacum]MDA4088824.1 intersectin-EH binding protein Ibp1 [Mycolicibacterium hassiacum DSM 44199]VCT91555.1 hypothetical protein MHAS_03270 [Mycolicibacterium hassiacum DSM 44199]